MPENPYEHSIGCLASWEAKCFTCAKCFWQQGHDAAKFKGKTAEKWYREAKELSKSLEMSREFVSANEYATKDLDAIDEALANFTVAEQEKGREG